MNIVWKDLSNRSLGHLSNDVDPPDIIRVKVRDQPETKKEKGYRAYITLFGRFATKITWPRPFKDREEAKAYAEMKLRQVFGCDRQYLAKEVFDLIHDWTGGDFGGEGVAGSLSSLMGAILKDEQVALSNRTPLLKFLKRLPPDHKVWKHVVDVSEHVR